MLDLFNRGKVKELEKALNVLNKENDDLRRVSEERYNYTQTLETGLESALNEVSEYSLKYNSTLTELKLAKNEILKLKQQIELKESQRRKMAGKVGGLMKEKNKLNEDLEYSRSLIKDLNHENYKYRSLYNTKKEVREYGKTKSERN